MAPCGGARADLPGYVYFVDHDIESAFSTPYRPTLPVEGANGVIQAIDHTSTPRFRQQRGLRDVNYAPAVAAGGLLFIAGQIGIRADGTVPTSVEEQIDLAFQRLGAILQSAGLGFKDLVELVSYHVDVDRQLAAFREIKDRYIKADAPAWTILGVAALAKPTLFVKIKAVAVTRAM